MYKGQLISTQLPEFFPDLLDPSFKTALAMVHQRFSTNTFPSWDRAHPYRFMSHNGEINTLRGNINWMHAREKLFSSPLFGDDIKKLLPIVEPNGSDSAMFDNCLELLIRTGRSLPHSVMMMIPEAWQNDAQMSDSKRAFYHFHSCMMEPWDGPASIAFTDGIRIGAVLDRNGLRPSRYTVTKDGLVVMASETGVLDIPPENVAQHGPPAAGQNVSHRYGARTNRSGRRDQAVDGGATAVSRVARRQLSSRSSLCPKRAARRRLNASKPASCSSSSNRSATPSRISK